MIKQWDKSSSTPKKFFQLAEGEAARLHPVSLQSKLPRLGCVLLQDDTPIWTTFCVSDFIAPGKMKSNDLQYDFSVYL